MPGRFPGMDPYLEDPAFWPDYHDRFIVYWSDALNEVLPDAYEARINERTRIVDLTAAEERVPRPDVAVHRGESVAPEWRGGHIAATLEPVTLPLQVMEEERETYIEIRRRPEREVVTALELLSPSNKEGTDRIAYLQKRNDLIHQDVHIVELDLLSGGERIPLRAPLPRGHYYYFVSRADRRFDCDVYAWSVRQPLPTLPVPLRAPDPDVFIDLAALFATAYDRGRYARALKYGAPPPASWNAEDRAWIEATARD